MLEGRVRTVGLLGCLAALTCHCGDRMARPPVESGSPNAQTSGNSAGSVSPPNASEANTIAIEVTGTAGGTPFKLVCARPGAGTGAQSTTSSVVVTDTPGRSVISCRDAKTGFELKLDIVKPKVGRMDASPNANASVVTFNAGAAGTPDSTDGGSNAALIITAWDPSGRRAGTFSMSWFDDARLKQKEGRFEGSFTL